MKPPLQSEDVDDLYALLSNSRRRHIIQMLECDRPMDLKEIADRIASTEHETPIGELTSRERKLAYMACYQTHIPRLREAGFVTSNEDTDDIRLTDRADRIRHRYGWEEPSITPHLAFLGLATAALVLLGAVILDISPVDVLSEVTIGLLIILAFTALSIGLSIRN